MSEQPTTELCQLDSDLADELDDGDDTRDSVDVWRHSEGRELPRNRRDRVQKQEAAKKSGNDLVTEEIDFSQPFDPFGQMEFEDWVAARDEWLQEHPVTQTEEVDPFDPFSPGFNSERTE